VRREFLRVTDHEHGGVSKMVRRLLCLQEGSGAQDGNQCGENTKGDAPADGLVEIVHNLQRDIPNNSIQLVLLSLDESFHL